MAIRKRILIFLTVWLTLSMALAACGGGGGSSTVTPTWGGEHQTGGGYPGSEDLPKGPGNSSYPAP